MSAAAGYLNELPAGEARLGLCLKNVIGAINESDWRCADGAGAKRVVSLAPFCCGGLVRASVPRSVRGSCCRREGGIVGDDMK